GARKFNVQTSGSYDSLEQVRNTVVGGAAGRITRLRDVADVEWGYADPTHIGRFNGRRAVFVTAAQDGSHNIQAVRDGIYRELAGFEKTLPAGVRLERAFDQSRNVAERLSQLGRDFAIAILLVLVTLLPLGLRAAGIVMLSIPLSVALGLAVLQATGYTLNQLSIVGFVIALGLLVDDSIVVVENISRFLREGHTRREAAVLATRQIALAVLGCTATLVLAFVPLLLLPGGPGMFIRSMPLTVIFTILASLLIALTITPWLGSVVLKEQAGEGNVFMRGLHRGIAVTYAPLLRRALAAPRRTVALSGALILASIALVPVVGFSLFPKAGTPQFIVDIDTPKGTSLAQTDRAARFVERTLAHHPQVMKVFTNVGRDNPQVYYNVIPRRENPSVGQLFALLDRYDTRATPAFLDSLRRELATYPDAQLQVKEFENGTAIPAPIELRVLGENLDTLRLLAASVEEVMKRTPGTMYVDNPVRTQRTDLRLAVDRAKAGLLGIATAELDRTVRLGVAGVTAGHLREANGEDREISVRLPHAGPTDVGTLDHIYFASATGAQVPLRQVADVRFTASDPAIDHYAGERMVGIRAHVQTGYNVDRVTKDVLRRVTDVRLPPGYRIMAAGEIESRQESFGGIGNAIIIAMFGILAILVLEFGSFRSTLIVASVIPLGIVGGIVAL
ncbi:MAG TPA: efflux RND transporter permease subunit, partial [Longimicrobiales bacterium]